ncbi:MAG: T9SS type A sorting domain-containing protein [Bacteroidales bacterium]|nr:T9SS type A sorting domain-containing protein [Bacteroidales bacterium]
MNKIILLSVFLFSISFSNAQIQNLNPDKNGEPWIVGGLRIPSEAEINKIPVVKLSVKEKSKALPSSLDNSSKVYFRPVFSQTDGCCAQASGIAYNYTYEINRERGTSANVSINQFPTHYTYNFLNGGDGSNGSWYTDGWDIIRADGCPTVSAYGGLVHSDATYWMSGYSNYENGMNNRVKDYFAIDVSTPEGLETLKHWMYDHLEGASDGSIVNFAAGVGDVFFNMTYDNKIIEWEHQVNHAMTFVGWDDNISYDYNNDGKITNDVDINNDGVADMKDWERGALIMVNSWGTSWGNYGKAYVMYKLLAEPVENGGIFANKVYGIHVKATQTPQLIMKVKIAHSSRNKIKITAGVSPDISDAEPQYILNFPLFNKQGGDYDMGGSGNITPIEIALDISSLLSYVNSGEDAKFFLKITEDDISSSGNGQIYDFSVKDNEGNEYVCSSHNVAINNNSETLMSVVASVNFETPEIITSSLPDGDGGNSYSYQLNATGGTEPYVWSLSQKYTEETISETYPLITSEQLTPSDNDDGYVAKTLDFEFPFYGTLYNVVYISTDGYILFQPGFSYLRTEDAVIANKMIAAFASDLMIYPANGDGIFYEGNSDYATFRWKTSLFDNQSANIDVAVTLYPSGKIDIFYGDNITTGLSWASGISNGAGSYVISSVSGISDPSNSKLSMTGEPFPVGMTISDSGVFLGTVPNEDNTWHIDFIVTDNNNISEIKALNFNTVQGESVIGDLKNKRSVSCYPNPFTEKTNILFHVYNYGSVNLSIFDVSGKKVAELVNSTQKSGTYKIPWNANVASGIYFYRLKTDNKIENGKLILR